VTRIFRLSASLTAVMAAALLTVAQPALAQSERPAAPPPPAGAKDGFFTTTDGIKIHYLLTGETGSWVVLIHGYSDSAQRMWFTTGIAPEIAKHHRVVALDNRNHGQSDKPQPGGSGRAQDIVELMDHLKIQKAHIHGYSMGGGITGQLLGMIPDRFITAGFGGSGLTETDPVFKAEGEALDAALPKATGADAAGMDRFRSRVAAARPASSNAAPPAPAPAVDLSTLNIPILAVNGSFDNPFQKTHRIWRQAREFQNVILPNKTHLTAIAASAPPDQQYIAVIAGFIDMYDRP